MSASRILVIDDESGLRHTLELILKDDGSEVLTAADGEEGLRVANAEDPDIILCDIRMPRLDGLGFVDRYREGGGEALIIMMSAYGTIETAIEAMRRGAYDFVSKPFRADQVQLVIRKAIEREKLRREVEHLRQEVAMLRPSEEIVGRSGPLRERLAQARRAARQPTTVLIPGESLRELVRRMAARPAVPFTASVQAPRVRAPRAVLLRRGARCLRTRRRSRA